MNKNDFLKLGEIMEKEKEKEALKEKLYLDNKKKGILLYSIAVECSARP